MGEEYYWELKLEGDAIKAIGPLRTLEFFLAAVQKGREHILNLYDRRYLNNVDVYKEATKVVKTFGIKDSGLEVAMAQILTDMVRMPETDKEKVVSVYMFDLMEKRILTPEDINDHAGRVYEYASCRASADMITVVYGIRSRPRLTLTRAEAETLGTGFSEGKRFMNMDSLLSNGRRFYNGAADAADRILTFDFNKLKRNNKVEEWEKRLHTNQKIARDYDKCLEILRTAHYKFFS